MSRYVIVRVKLLIAGASLVLALPSCVSSRLEPRPDHPASPKAAVMPLPAVGAALSEDVATSSETTSGSSAAPSHGEHSHSPAQATPPGGADQHGAHAAPEAAPAGNAHANHRAPASTPEPAGERWTCPMHPEVVQSQPGKCPKCGMKFVPAQQKTEQ